MGKILWAILALILFFAFAGNINTGIHDIRTEELTESFSGVVTAAGISAANVTLASDPFLDRTAEVVSITSNITETPVATTYTTATNFLLVGSLGASETRTLTVVYDSQRDDDYMAIIGPFMTFLILGGILFAIGWGLLKKKGGR